MRVAEPDTPNTSGRTSESCLLTLACNVLNISEEEALRLSLIQLLKPRPLTPEERGRLRAICQVLGRLLREDMALRSRSQSTDTSSGSSTSGPI